MSEYDGEVALRPGVPGDAEALLALHLDCWDDAYTGLMPQSVLDARRVSSIKDPGPRLEQRRSMLAQGRTWLAEVPGSARLVGFAVAGPPREEDPVVPLELYALYVRAAHWGTGVGHRLLQASVGAEPCLLWVLEGNERALRFYRRQGFELDGRTEESPEGRHLGMVRRTRHR